MFHANVIMGCFIDVKRTASVRIGNFCVLFVKNVQGALSFKKRC
jgi:hypothetical protein